jgi:hypothetical protein
MASIVLTAATAGGTTSITPTDQSGTVNLTLPNATGTLLSSVSSISGSNITGAQSIPKSTLPTGSLLQVVNFASYTTVTISTTTETATGYSVSITPTSASSKILISFSCSEFRVPSNCGANILLYKNGSVLTYVAREFGYVSTSTFTFGNIISSSYLDSPATTSSITYSIYARLLTGTGTLEFVPNGSNNTANKNVTFTLMEISA